MKSDGQIFDESPGNRQEAPDTQSNFCRQTPWNPMKKGSDEDEINFYPSGPRKMGHQENEETLEGNLASRVGATPKWVSRTLSWVTLLCVSTGKGGRKEATPGSFCCFGNSSSTPKLIGHSQVRAQNRFKAID